MKTQNISHDDNIHINSNNMGNQENPHLSENQASMVNLDGKMIGPEGCKQLSQRPYPGLQSLRLWKNNIGDQGCSYIKKGKWPILRELMLRKNNIGSQGCKQISQAKWENLQILHLDENNLGIEGCNQISKGHWPVLKTLYLQKNNIGDKGCHELSNNEWPSLQQLNLRDNNIKSLSFQIASTPHYQPFHNIRVLSLDRNMIESLEPLSRLSAQFLQSIQLTKNKITVLNPILKLKSRKLKKLNLDNNYMNQVQGLECMVNSFEELRLNQWDSKRSLTLSRSIRPLMKCEFRSTIYVEMTTKLQKEAANRLTNKYKRRIVFSS